MNANDLTKLAGIAVDVAAIDGGSLVGMQAGEMADGSRRSFALVSTIDVNQLEQEYRITSPAPDDAPAWTSQYGEWRLEVRIGESWSELELELDFDEHGIAVAPEREDDETDRAYETASADVVVPLSTADAEAIADALEMFAGIDDNENTDYDELVRLAGIVRANLGTRS